MKWIFERLFRDFAFLAPTAMVFLGVECSAGELAGGKNADTKKESPGACIEAYQKMKGKLLLALDGKVKCLEKGGALKLTAKDGMLVPNICKDEVQTVKGDFVEIPACGMLAFQIETKETTRADGMLSLLPDKDQRPGLRAYVLSDSTLIAAPMVMAETPWEASDFKKSATVGVIPEGLKGLAPSTSVNLSEWMLPAGRHLLIVLGPFFRNGGTFQELSISSSSKYPEELLGSFAFMADLHRGGADSTWINTKLGEVLSPSIQYELEALKSSGCSFCLLGGDFCDWANKRQFESLATLLRKVKLPVYACMGNHDVWDGNMPDQKVDARKLIMETVPEIFPKGCSRYEWMADFKEGQRLRFIFLDFPVNETEQLNWLERSLQDDTGTPTVIVAHENVLCSGKTTPSGYKLPKWDTKKKLLNILQGHPQAVAVLNGHAHWDEVNKIDGLTVIQNAAMAEWPNSYRVFRVYRDHLEWEVRIISNLGALQSTFIRERPVSFQILSSVSDLSGTIKFPRQIK